MLVVTALPGQRVRHIVLPGSGRAKYGRLPGVLIDQFRGFTNLAPTDDRNIIIPASFRRPSTPILSSTYSGAECQDRTNAKHLLMPTLRIRLFSWDDSLGDSNSTNLRPCAEAIPRGSGQLYLSVSTCLQPSDNAFNVLGQLAQFLSFLNISIMSYHYYSFNSCQRNPTPQKH